MQIQYSVHVQGCVYGVWCMVYCLATRQCFQGFQTDLPERPGLEQIAQLKTLVTDDINRDQTDSVLLSSPKMSGEHK